jgi:tRNA-intron endonuclease
MNKIEIHLLGDMIFSNSPESMNLQEKSSLGEKKQGKVIYTLVETLFLLERKKANILVKNKEIEFKDLLKKLSRKDKKLPLKYICYKDLREKGYVVKTALKFGADFRVYPKGKRPGTEHAKWIVFVESEKNSTSWHEFSSKNRVAHSTKKNLLLAIVDEEEDITYYEVKWIKP